MNGTDLNAEYLDALVASWPPLTPGQRDIIVEILLSEA